MADLKLPRLNKILISGRIVRDIEMRYTAKGTPVVNFVLATDRSYKDETGTYQNISHFHDVVAWNLWAENLQKFAHKGSPVIVEGRLETRTYTDSNNNNRKVVEIIAEYIQFLEVRGKAETTSAEPEEEHLSRDEEQAPLPITNDDVPF